MNYMEVAEKWIKTGACYDYSLSNNKDTFISELLGQIDLKRLSELYTNYPQYGYGKIKAIIQNMFQVDKVLLGNGSEDIIWRLNRMVLRKKRTAVVIPTFYRITDTLTNPDLIRIPPNRTGCLQDVEILESLLDLSMYQVIWLTNPNSITGQAFDNHSLSTLAKRYPNVMFIFDETSIINTKIMTDKYSMIPFTSFLDNILVIRSFSKFYGLPGLRLGFLCGNERYLTEMENSSSIFPHSSSHLAVIECVSQQLGQFDQIAMEIQRNKTILSSLLHRITFGVLPSITNCILIYTEGERPLCETFMDENILTMALHDYPGMDGLNSVRITVHSGKEEFGYLYNQVKRLFHV